VKKSERPAKGRKKICLQESLITCQTISALIHFFENPKKRVFNAEIVGKNSEKMKKISN
jgi:hypothetical protein